MVSPLQGHVAVDSISCSDSVRTESQKVYGTAYMSCVSEDCRFEVYYIVLTSTGPHI